MPRNTRLHARLSVEHLEDRRLLAAATPMQVVPAQKALIASVQPKATLTLAPSKAEAAQPAQAARRIDDYPAAKKAMLQLEADGQMTGSDDQVVKAALERLEKALVTAKFDVNAAAVKQAVEQGRLNFAVSGLSLPPQAAGVGLDAKGLVRFAADLGMLGASDKLKDDGTWTTIAGLGPKAGTEAVLKGVIGGQFGIPAGVVAKLTPTELLDGVAQSQLIGAADGTTGRVGFWNDLASVKSGKKTADDFLADWGNGGTGTGAQAKADQLMGKPAKGGKPKSLLGGGASSQGAQAATAGPKQATGTGSGSGTTGTRGSTAGNDQPVRGSTNIVFEGYEPAERGASGDVGKGTAGTAQTGGGGQGGQQATGTGAGAGQGSGVTPTGEGKSEGKGKAGTGGSGSADGGSEESLDFEVISGQDTNGDGTLSGDEVEYVVTGDAGTSSTYTVGGSDSDGDDDTDSGAPGVEFTPDPDSGGVPLSSLDTYLGGFDLPPEMTWWMGPLHLGGDPGNVTPSPMAVKAADALFQKAAASLKGSVGYQPAPDTGTRPDVGDLDRGPSYSKSNGDGVTDPPRHDS